MDPVTTPVVKTSFRSQASRGIFISTGYDVNNEKLLTLRETLIGDLSRFLFVQRPTTVWMQCEHRRTAAESEGYPLVLTLDVGGEQIRRSTPTDKLRLQ